MLKHRNIKFTQNEIRHVIKQKNNTQLNQLKQKIEDSYTEVSDIIQCLWIKTSHKDTVQNYKHLTIDVYRSPDGDFVIFLQKLETVIKKIIVMKNR